MKEIVKNKIADRAKRNQRWIEKAIRQCYNWEIWTSEERS